MSARANARVSHFRKACLSFLLLRLALLCISPTLAVPLLPAPPTSSVAYRPRKLARAAPSPAAHLLMRQLPAALQNRRAAVGRVAAAD